MHDPGGVRVREPLEQRAGDLDGFAERQRAAIERDPQRLALDQLHHEVWLTVGRDPEIMDLHDVRVVEPGDGARLAAQQLEPRGAGRLVQRVQELDRHLPRQLAIERAKHHAHTAAAEHLAQLEAAVSDERRRSLRGRSAAVDVDHGA
jgi:hypothetical protein